MSPKKAAQTAQGFTAEEKAANDPKKKKKLVKQSAPEGSVSWDAKTFERLRTALSR